MSLDPPRWTADQLEAARRIAVDRFRQERMQEPLDEYLRVFAEYQEHVAALLVASSDLLRLREQAASLLASPRGLEILRYLAGPPISLDDLKVVADVPSAGSHALARSPDHAARIVNTVLLGLDRRRFPWVEADRAPHETERAAAVVASAALIAAQRVATVRRQSGQTRQEESVKAILREHGFREVPPRSIATLSDGPAPGEFCGESVLGARKADLVVGLWDRRTLAIECKVSNSATNSIKRLNNDAAAKAVAWLKDFGERQTVPAAVLSGVYKLRNLEDAQRRGLTLFWSHDLAAMLSWIDEVDGRGRALLGRGGREGPERPSRSTGHDSAVPPEKPQEIA